MGSSTSGNFGHAGRPGEVGGSSEEGGGSTKKLPNKFNLVRGSKESDSDFEARKLAKSQEKGVAKWNRRIDMSSPSSNSELYRRMTEEGGFGVHPTTGDEPPKSGIMTATSKATEKVIPMKDFSEGDIARYREAHAKELSVPGAHVGGWVDKGKAYLDVSTRFTDKAAGMKAAQQAHQLAVFDLKSGQSVPVTRKLKFGGAQSTVRFRKGR
jgi:hypothetical protein